jgi:hypothetical protein
MSNLKIKTYTGGEYGSHTFFILSRGNNSGKPLNEPCPNCFVCQCSSAEEKEKAYWLFYALWQGKQCEQLLVGSVIPFIRKNDLIGLVNRFWSSLSSLDETKKMIKQLNVVQEQEQNFHKMLKLSNQLKMVISRKMLQLN